MDRIGTRTGTWWLGPGRGRRGASDTGHHLAPTHFVHHGVDL